MTSPQLASQVSGYSTEEMQACYDWMAAFAVTVHEMGPMQLKSFSQVAQDDIHNIQTHSVDLDTLVRLFFIIIIHIYMLVTVFKYFADSLSF